MKVYILTEAALFQGEKIIGVSSTRTKAEKVFRKLYPHMKKWDGDNGEFHSVSDVTKNPMLLFIHEREVD